MPARHPTIARALGLLRIRLQRAFETMPASVPRDPGARTILVACSGGPDSVALVGLLERLRQRDALRLVVGHVDHGLRASSSAEAEAVKTWATALGLDVHVTRLALTRGPGLPARARDERRLALQAQAEAAGARIIALGHTATDQAETMLLHLARGAGLEGLAAMSDAEPWPSGAGVWARPLLDLVRTETRELAERLGHPFVDDPTNVDHKHPRAVVRHDVLPALARLHTGAELAIAGASDRAREAEDALTWWAKRELARRRLLDGWTIETLSGWPKAFRHRFLRALCEQAHVDLSSLTRRTIVDIDGALLRGGPSRGWDLRPNMRLVLERGRIRVVAAPRGRASGAGADANGSPHQAAPAACKTARRT